jgi:hypothetical protein
MALFEGFFAEKHPNFDHIAHAIESNLGLTVGQPTPDVSRVLDGLSNRELVGFDNLRSVEGVQELFRAKSIRAVVDLQARTLSLSLVSAEEIDRQRKAEQTQVRVLKLAKLESTQKPAKPARVPVAAQPATLGAPAAAAAPPVPVVPGFENLEACERLTPNLVDMFVRQGLLTTADKDVLKAIKPTNASLEARVVALERWQAELTRRVRGIMLPKLTPHLIVGPAQKAQTKPEETLVRRFDAVVHWLGKLVKAFETTGIRFHNKPMWLPH